MHQEQVDESQLEKFSFFVPATIEKGKKNGVEEMRIKGVASYLSEDTDGQTLDPAGFDFQPLLTQGHLNWDHQAKLRASAIIGECDFAELQDNNKAFYVEGFLYPDSDDARDVYKLALVLEKNSKTRRLGFSIEGVVLEKDPDNPNWIKRARIIHIAITPMPKNPNTLMQVMKGETATPLMECNGFDCDIKKAMETIQLEKAMSAESASEEGLIPEHIEGTKNPNKHPLKGGEGSECQHELGEDGKCSKCDHVAKLVTKSEIYNLIAENYTTNIEVAKQIFSLIKSTNQKIYSMTDSKITLESVNKAFEFLEKATEVEQLGTDLVTDAPLEKGDKAAAIDEKDKEKESEDLEKAVEMCKSFDPKKSKEEMVEECKKGGFAEATAASAADSCIAAANAAKDGGTISTVQPSLVKAEEVQTLQVGEDFQGLVKGLATTLIQHSDKKFQSIGNILKYESEQNIILKGQVDALTTKVETLLAAPQPKKSITTAQAVERFDKGQEAGAIANGTDVYDLNKSEDVSLLGDRLMNEALVLRESGNVNSLLEKAVGDLDISKSLPVQIIPYLKAKKIAVIMPGQTGIEK